MLRREAADVGRRGQPECGARQGPAGVDLELTDGLFDQRDRVGRDAELVDAQADEQRNGGEVRGHFAAYGDPRAPDRGTAHFVDQADGIVIPAHASALGKAMLAFLPEEADRLLDAPSLRSMTGETLTEPAALKEALSDIRASGIAVECDEAVLGESCVAATVFDASGLAVGAVAVVVPTTEWPVDDAVVEAVRSTARTVSRELGAAQWPATPSVP